MSDFINIQCQDYSFFGSGSLINGKFGLKGHTKIAGTIEGEVTMIDGSDITIERTGELIGTINCHNLNIYGNFSGKVNSTGKVSIFPSAQVSGELKSRSLNITPGARVNIDGHTLEKKN